MPLSPTSLAPRHSRLLLPLLSALLWLAGCSGTKATTTSTAVPAISVALTPAATTLAGTSTQAFTATLANDTTNAGVTWSLGTGAGTLGGVTTTTATYTAPTLVPSTKALTLTATSRADTTKSATAAITLAPISVALSASTAPLAPGAAETITATVSNDPQNAGVNWSLTGVGTLSASTSTNVTYTAPPGLPAATVVTLTATTKSDSTKTAVASISLAAPTQPASAWVYYNNAGQLTYKLLNTSGDHIMDFSTAGYGGGGVTLPTAAVAATVTPTGGDDTSAIQAAITTVSALPLNATTGLRGAVLLSAGNFKVSGSLTISASGVVLRGSGSGATGGTVITMSPASTPYPLVVIAGKGTPTAVGSSTVITDSYVPSGTLTLDLASTAGLSVGTNVIVQRPVTSAWINYMGMTVADLGTTCSGGACNWIDIGNSGLRTERTITAINGNQITLDAPMSDSIDSIYCGTNGGTVYAYTYSGRISQVGVESFSVVAPALIGVVGNPTYQLVTTTSVVDAWIRNLAAQDTLQSVDIDSESKRITVSNVAITHTITQTGSAQFEEFYIASATQVLMDTVSDTADDMYFFATSSETEGPNVLRNATFNGNLTIEPHQRWATGLLVENTSVGKGPSTQGGINFRDRGDYGTGHGWTIGWGVVWNSSGGAMVIQQPPGSENWCIGCVGTQTTQAAPGGSTVLPQGAIDSPGVNVFPTSLYAAQLGQRLSQ